MATTTGFSGRRWGCLLGISDIDAGSSVGAVGSATMDDNATTKSRLRVTSPVNDIAFGGGYQTAEIERAGNATFRSEDIVQHYGSGIWTWDFDYPVDNEQAVQQLLTLIYPSTGTAVTTALTIPETPTVEDYSHGANTGVDRMAFLVIQNALADSDRMMHSAVLQNLTFSMSSDTNSGLLNMAGQFMSGYKPIIGANTLDGDSTAGQLSNYSKGLFDCTTHTFAGQDVAVKSFSLTIDNPANRIGYQGSAGETDGYVRPANIGVTGSISIKADEAVQDFLVSKWQGATPADRECAISLGDSSLIDFSIPTAIITDFTLDQANEGIFADISFRATCSVDGGGSLAVIKCT